MLDITNENYSDYIALYHTHGLWIPDRKIYLRESGESEDDVGINHRTADELIKNIHVLERLGREPITVIVNTGGGYDTSSKAIYDVIRGSECRMIGIGVGEVSSAGITVMQAFDERRAYRSTTFMVHDGDDGFTGTLRDVERRADEIRRNRLDYYRLLEERTGQDHKFWARRLQNDWWLTAEQAKAEGLIDEVI